MEIGNKKALKSGKSHISVSVLNGKIAEVHCERAGYCWLFEQTLSNSHLWLLVKNIFNKAVLHPLPAVPGGKCSNPSDP